MRTIIEAVLELQSRMGVELARRGTAIGVTAKDTDSLCIRFWQYAHSQGIKHMSDRAQLRKECIYMREYVLHGENPPCLSYLCGGEVIILVTIKD